jgi:hypothetical protein
LHFKLLVKKGMEESMPTPRRPKVRKAAANKPPARKRAAKKRAAKKPAGMQPTGRVRSFEAQGSAFAARAEPEPSGRVWVSRFPGSKSTDDLIDGFRQGVVAFVQAMSNGGANVRISATFRPPQRAYLMHHCWRIAREGADPRRIPSMPGVDIAWAHTDASGRFDEAASRRAARDMVAAYDMAHRAALRSRHTERRAIDMTISWSGTLNIADARGGAVAIGAPRGNANPRLHVVGRTYGVIKLATDPPHWSTDGH